MKNIKNLTYLNYNLIDKEGTNTPGFTAELVAMANSRLELNATFKVRLAFEKHSPDQTLCAPNSPNKWYSISFWQKFDHLECTEIWKEHTQWENCGKLLSHILDNENDVLLKMLLLKSWFDEIFFIRVNYFVFSQCGIQWSK